NGSSKCLPCKEDEYIEYPNDFPKCFGCRTCREDQVQLSPCTATKNTQCGCKNGTFCSPDHPCEMCQKCRSRCLDGEVEKAPCTPHSDRQCGPPTRAASSLWGKCWTAGGGRMGLRVGDLGGCCEPCCPRNRDCKAQLPDACLLLPPQDYILLQLRRCAPGGLGMQDNDHNEQVSQKQQQELLSAKPGLGAPVMEVCECLWSFMPSIMTSSILTVVLERSFYIFSEEIDYKDWRKYGRALDLRENDIVFACKKEEYSPEALVQMLRTWLQKQGMKASVNVLLETLDQIDLGGVAERISSLLVQKGFFQYEEVS
ncbi:TR10B factor, partial [Nothocercus julius]|nr:TR10B factor [Nothocercus julius]